MAVEGFGDRCWRTDPGRVRGSSAQSRYRIGDCTTLVRQRWCRRDRRRAGQRRCAGRPADRPRSEQDCAVFQRRQYRSRAAAVHPDSVQYQTRIVSRTGPLSQWSKNGGKSWFIVGAITPSVASWRPMSPRAYRRMLNRARIGCVPLYNSDFSSDLLRHRPPRRKLLQSPAPAGTPPTPSSKRPSSGLGRAGSSLWRRSSWCRTPIAWA